MTYKWRKTGFFKWKKYHYTLLDNFADLEFTSPEPLDPKECDLIFDTVNKLNATKGELSTQKGRIIYKYNPKIWTEIKNENTNENTRNYKKV